MEEGPEPHEFIKESVEHHHHEEEEHHASDGARRDAVISASTGTQVNGHWVDIVWTIGYGFIALAAWWPVQPAARSFVDGPTSLWQMLLPWLGLVGVMVTALILVVTSRPISAFLIYPGVALVVLLMASQFLAYKDSGPMLYLTRLQQVEHEAYATLLARDAGVNTNDVVVAGQAGPKAAILVERCAREVRRRLDRGERRSLPRFPEARSPNWRGAARARRR